MKNQCFIKKEICYIFITLKNVGINTVNFMLLIKINPVNIKANVCLFYFIIEKIMFLFDMRCIILEQIIQDCPTYILTPLIVQELYLVVCLQITTKLLLLLKIQRLVNLAQMYCFSYRKFQFFAQILLISSNI